MIKVNVEIHNKSWNKKIQNPKKYFKNKLKKISKILKFLNGKNITFTILLTNSINMKKLNKKFRNKNKATDVLSFPFFTLNSLKLIKKNCNPIRRFLTIISMTFRLETLTSHTHLMPCSQFLYLFS